MKVIKTCLKKVDGYWHMIWKYKDGNIGFMWWRSTPYHRLRLDFLSHKSNPTMLERQYSVWIIGSNYYNINKAKVELLRKYI